LDANDDLIVEWSLNGTTWNLLRTLDGGSANQTYSNTIAWTPADTTFILRFRAEDDFEGGEDAYIDDVQVSFNVPANAVGAQVVRTANLTGVTAPSLTLTTTSAGLGAGDTVVLEAATSPAGPFTPLATSTGNIGAGAFVPAGPYDLSPYASATTAIQLRVTGGYNATTKALNIDNVDISYGATSTFASGAPPALLASSAGCRVSPNNSMTVTFNVTLDDPFPANVDEILNTATSGATEIPVPLQASALNIVTVPGGGSGTVGDRVWLDTDADGLFDPGETGIAGVEVTLKDQYGTPLQATTTDSQGRYTFIDVAPGSGYFVEVTGGLPTGLTQTTDTVGDGFDINGVFTGNHGTLNWLTNWTENNDDANAAAGDIQIANNRIEFRDTTDGGTVATGESIQRSATVTGATSLELQYSWDSVALETDGTDNIIVEYSLNGTTWTTARTLNGSASGTYTDTIPWLPTNSTAFVRFRAEDAIEAGEQARIDNVQLRFTQDLRTANFSLSVGQNYVQADLGYRADTGTATIGDTVWVDANSDQFRNPGEVGLAGITVQLFEDTNGDGLPDGGAVATTVTGPGGAYLFSGITANGAFDYVVTMNTGQAPLSGYTATTPTLFSYPNLASGAVRVDADFGFVNPTSTFTITDGVWLDNGAGGGTASDGLKNGAEGGIGGVTVDLLNSAGSTIATTITASNGTFQFTGVPGGQNYRWRITDDANVLADYYGTTSSALSGNFQITGNLTGNLNYTSPSDVRHFGYNQTRTIGDTVWNDNGAGGGTAGNGVQDGTEPGIAGVTVLLYQDVNNNGIYEPGGADGTAFATHVTDLVGHYLFAGLPNGFRWFVSIDQTQSALSGFTTLTTAADFDGNAANGHQRQVTPILTGGANRLDIDYGYRTLTPFTLSGRFWSDVNRNGVDNSEAGLSGVTLELTNASGLAIGTTSTAADGSYSFAGLPAGTYTVRVSDTNGVLTGAETTFERTELGLAASYNGQETVTLGPTTSNVNFGYYRGNALVTRAILSSFVARDVAGAQALEWTTVSEIGTVGFHLKRWDDREGKYVDVNEKLIPALITSPQGGVYRYLDREVLPGEPYRYLIVEVEASGRRRTYGPYDVDTRMTPLHADAEAMAEPATGDAMLLDRGDSRTPRGGRAVSRRVRTRAVGETRPRQAPRLKAQAAKISVAEDGIYYVSLQDLQAQGGLTAPSHRPELFALTNRGKPVAFAPSSDLTGILFYGLATESNVEGANVYRLSNAIRDRRWMKTRPNVEAPPPTGGEVFTKTLHVEEDVFAANNVYKDPEGDFWVWDYVFAGFGAKSFAFRTDGAAGFDGGVLTVRLKGGTETVAYPDHHATFSLNGSPIGEAFWDGTQDLETALEFDGSLLVDGENTLTIDGLTDTGAPYSLFYVDSFDVRYTSRYRAHGNKVKAPAAGNASVLISGFTRPDIAVFDITRPTEPVFVQAPVALTGDGTYGVELASSNLQAVYYAVTPDALRSASRILPDAPSALRRADNEGEYLVITTEILKETAQTLADHRSDLKSQVVDIEDIYDEFNYGNPNPYAVKAFLTYARSRWKVRPRYVVLAGDGTYDYKDVLGEGDNLIPPMMASTPDGLFPSDAWFVEAASRRETGIGRRPVEIAIGRLPVTTPAELAEVIRKTVARESALVADEPWVHNTLLVADDADAAGDFLLSSERVASLVPAGVPLARAYVSVVGAAQTRSDLIGALNDGVGAVSYVGHAGFDQLADEPLLTSADVASLVNHDRPAVMTAMTCLAGNSALPGYSVIGESLLRQDGGGLAAFFGPSGMSENDLAEPLADAFYSAAFSGRSPRIGDAVNAARRAYRARDLPSYMLAIYNLLGDPAMRLR
jgi:hypothetical protein